MRQRTQQEHRENDRSGGHPGPALSPIPDSFPRPEQGAVSASGRTRV
jgi:hypothetical protein